MTALTAPRYGEDSLADLGLALLRAVGAEEVPDPIGIPSADRVILVVIDGLGLHQLQHFAEHAPFLAANIAPRTLTSVFPSTTTAALTSIGTGLAPGHHGMLGYTIVLPGHDLPLNLLTWQWGPPTRATDARDQHPPETLQAAATIFERAGAVGIDTTVVSPAAYVDSGLTRAALRGARYVGAVGAVAVLDAALAAATATRRALVYAHHGNLDTAGHLYGVGSDEYLAALGGADAAIADAADRLPGGTTLLVTADHGMVAMRPEACIEMTGDAALEQDVRVVAGESRVRQLHVEAGRADAVAARYRQRLGDDFLVVTRDDAVTRGWFGPDPDDDLIRRAGDVLAVASAGRALVHRQWDPFGGRLAGMHGALTAEEVDVPLIVVTSGT